MEGRMQLRRFREMLGVLLVLALSSTPLGAAAGTAPCDWQRGDAHKMHWPQLPDLGATGVDVSLSRVTLADDFKCTATGPIRDIHF